MGNKTSVLLVNSSEDYIMLLSASINEQEDMEVLATALDGEQALVLARELKPQVIVMDVLLRKLDGVAFLRELRSGGDIPQTIVVSSFISDAVAADIASLGVKYCFAKPCRISELISRIRDCAHPEPAELTSCGYDTEVTNALINFGVIPKLQGFRYLREAICQNLEDGDAIKGITKNLYPDLGKVFRTNAKCIERGMRNALDTAWEHITPEARNACFGELTEHLPKRPSNSQFIALITEYIHMNERRGQRGGTGGMA